jgi:hypothetical protein
MSTEKMHKDLIKLIDEYGNSKSDNIKEIARRALLERLDKVIYDIFFEGFEDGKSSRGA